MAVERTAPRLVTISVSGEALQGFTLTQPTSHIKIFLPTEGDPVVRTYTPLRYDADANVLDIQFVLHGEGPASIWAASARVGDELSVAGPGGRFQLDESVASWWIAGDESAVPAITGLLGALPSSVRVDVHIEVADGADELTLARPVTWHHRTGGFGDALLAAAEHASAEQYWVACEAGAVRGIRRLLLDRGVTRDALTTRGYWRAGEANHPDHDYGDD